MVDRVHKLGQAAQVGDLLAERVDQYLEALEEMARGNRPGAGERVRMARENLDRAMGAYRSVRE